MGLALKTLNLCILLVVIVVAVERGETSSVCKNGLCNCTPAYREIAVIDCRCNTTKTGFEFTADDFGGQFRKVRDFYVSDCNGGITFKMNAFKDLEELENLYVDNVGKVEFDSGVFQTLTRISLRNIQELNLGESAFMGAHDLRSIEITRATVLQLRSHSLFDIKGLHNLELSDVILHRIEKDAINIDLRLPESKVLIKNCTIGSIESKGIVLKAQNFSIVKSSFGEMSSNAISISSSELVFITESDFRTNLSKNEISVLANVLNIRSNTFESFPTGISMKDVKYEDIKTIIFTNNTVYNIDPRIYFSSISDLIDRSEFRGNHFPCTCSAGGLYQFLPGFSQNNFCIASKCTITLRQFSALIEEKKVCTSNSNEDPDEYEICANVAYSTSHPPHGRTPSYFRTTERPSTIKITTNNPTNSSDRIPFVPVVMIFALFTAIFNL